MEIDLVTQSGWIEANGTRFYYEAQGTGEPLLLIHGLNLDTRMWERQAAVFAQFYRVIRFDLRGMGRTPIGEGPYTVYGDTRAVLEGLGVERAHVVGLSFGGMVAQEFALAWPEMVKRLVLVSSGLLGHPRSERRQRDAGRIAELIESGSREEAVELAARMWFDGPDQPVNTEAGEARENFRQMTAHAYSLPPVTQMPAWLSPLPKDRLEEIKVPTLVIAGGRDYEDFLQIADELAARISGAEKAVLEASAHIPPMDQPEAFNRLVLDFLGRK
ncbi:pimeloyl-ACP methyl ester carboxylesterase [Brevibacillus aydinogluensis]|jgi:3-oxoadipate enol-lactonase|uniref:Pimeloyl-CoA synthetase n=1 Tax=Brevibacillus aydinogluensis TaxID=927786 RepID=A0AA48M6I1_9BACL|nr:alpha/beta fold hydrolase [Brevibacillus aydinogluensis]MDT3416011.1 pimeloyl-ACP methyl ester carboxylesterase [Brevibacillus aydinogluensis]CAJ1001563.1 Pimeloyl-CoA synthetase [Brevibacillus aydinogluensis]